MRTVWTIVKKELSRFFKDKRMLVALFLPGILIYALYSLLGGVMESMFESEENQTYRVCVVNCPEWLTEEALASYGVFELQTASAVDENVEEKIKDGTFNAYLVFPNSFNLENNGSVLQEVKLYLDSTDTLSQSAGQALMGALSSVQYGAPKFLLTPQDVASEAELSSMIFSMIGPMLILVMLMTGCIAVAPESIAGEKERGTLATMLVTPVKRSRIAVGKLLALSIISVLSGLSSFIGIVLSLPKLMSGTGVEISALTYGAGEYLALLGIVLSSVLVMVGVVSIASTFAKSVKEASGMVSPIMILALVAGMTASFLPTSAWYVYCIPLINSAAAMNGIFSLAFNPLHVVLTVSVNFAAAILLSLLLTKMFDSEKIVFSK